MTGLIIETPTDFYRAAPEMCIPHQSAITRVEIRENVSTRNNEHSPYLICKTSFWGVETNRLAGTTPPNWRVGGKKDGLYRLEIGSEIDLVTWQYDLATECSGMPARGRGRF